MRDRRPDFGKVAGDGSNNSRLSPITGDSPRRLRTGSPVAVLKTSDDPAPAPGENDSLDRRFLNISMPVRGRRAFISAPNAARRETLEGWRRSILVDITRYGASPILSPLRVIEYDTSHCSFWMETLRRVPALDSLYSSEHRRRVGLPAGRFVLLARQHQSSNE